MNKHLIVLLAICLVSAHAFVKRDAPATPDSNKNYLDTLTKQFGEFTNNINSQMAHAFDPEEIKKKFNEMVDNVSKTVNSLNEKQKPAA